jgi:hypothetical protein
MAEVYTISGAAPDFVHSANPFGPSPNTTATGSAAAPSSSPASSGAPAPVLLQNALKALGTLAGDPALTRVKVDGVIGSKTVTAVNYALSHYIGATQYFPRADLTLAKVRQYAGSLAQIITNQVQQRGGTIPTPKIEKAVVHRRASGGGVPFAPPPEPAPATDNRKWVWWVVGGISVLLALSVAAATTKRRRVRTAEA